MYSFLRNLGPKETSTDRIASGAFAKGLEVLRKSFHGKQKLSLEKSLRNGVLAAIAEYGDHVPMEKKAIKGVDRVATALQEYINQWHPETDHIQPDFTADGEPKVEYTFSIPMPIDNPETG